MSKAISLHIGINNLSSHYNGSGFDNLERSIESAKNMQKIARPHFRDTVLDFAENSLFADGGEHAPPTIEKVCEYIKGAADILREGDIFLLTYAGHGSQIKFPDTPQNEKGFDETWCLDERQFFDDEILELFSFFNSGVRILFISDSCHSGTLISKRLLSEYLEQLPKEFDFENFDRKLYIDFGSNFENIVDKYKEDVGERDLHTLGELGIDYNGFENRLFSLPRVSSLSKVLGDSVYEANQELYNRLMAKTRERLRRRLPRGVTEFEKLIKASVIQISACQDDDTTDDGVFTETLINVLNNGSPIDYRDFHTQIKTELMETQVPSFKLEGNDAEFNEKFAGQLPFKVEAP